MIDPVIATRRELAIRYAARGTETQLSAAVRVLDETGGVDRHYRPVCAHQITTLYGAHDIACAICGEAL